MMAFARIFYARNRAFQWNEKISVLMHLTNSIKMSKYLLVERKIVTRHVIALKLFIFLFSNILTSIKVTNRLVRWWVDLILKGCHCLIMRRETACHILMILCHLSPHRNFFLSLFLFLEDYFCFYYFIDKCTVQFCQIQSWVDKCLIKCLVKCH